MSEDPISSGSVDPHRQLNDIREFVKALRQDFEKEKNELYEEIEDVHEENFRLRQEIEELETELEEVKESTNLLRLVEQKKKPEGDQAKAALILHLKKKAERQANRHGKRPVASLDRDAAADALHHPDVHRTTINKWMQRAADSVDSKVLQYDGGVLKINLQVGDVPKEVVTNVTEGDL